LADQSAQVLQPATAWQHDRLATKLVELVLAGEFEELATAEGAH
jgi:hypothetical protein